VPFDANLLITLAVLLKTRSVTRAAAQLNTSQPSVSRALAQLRTLLGDPLLVRTRGGMALTRRAEELSAPLQNWLAATTSLLEPEQFDPAALVRRFRIASTDFGVLAVIAPALEQLAEAAPGATVEIVPLRGGSMLGELTSGSVDLLVSGLEPNPAQTHTRRLFAEDFSCLFRRDHPLGRGSGPVPLETFLAWPHIALTVGDDDFDRIDQRLGVDGAARRVIARLPYFGIAPFLIGGSDALVTLPTTAARRMAGSDLTLRPAPLEVGTFDYWLVWHERTARDPASIWLRDLLAAPACICGMNDIRQVHLPAT
jgi:DNA-binding transcriptional LysR family regulator